MSRLSLPYYYTRGGSKFEPTESFLEASTVVDTNVDKFENVGIPLAQIDYDTYATSGEEKHCFVIGETGCGKTRRVIFPTIRLMAKAGESMVISDPKGELYRQTADSLRKKGYVVNILNFRKPRCGDRWNPLGMIEKLYKSDDIEDKDKAALMINDLISIISTKYQNNQDDTYWLSSAQDIFRAVTSIILDYGKDGELTFENIFLTAKRVHQAISSGSISRKEKHIKMFIDQLPDDSDIKQNLAPILKNAESTRNCIIAFFRTLVSDFCNQELLNDMLSKTEIDIESIGLRPTALFIVLPDDSDSMYPIATCLIKQIYSSLVAIADSQKNGQLPNKVTFLLDEFANFAKIPAMHAMLTAARSRKIRFVLVCQSMEQLIEKYKESGMEILISNCRTWLYMNCRNLPFLRRLEELAGSYTSPYTGERCPLVDIGTLQHFSMGQVLIFNDRCRPVLGFIDDYSKYDFGEDGPGEIIEMPEPHPIIERARFSLDDIAKEHVVIDPPPETLFDTNPVAPPSDN